MSGSVSIFLASAWIPFVVAVVLIFIISWIYIIKYRSRYDSECSTTTVNVVSLTIALLTLALVPVDVFSVSFMKNADGTFKDWATNSSVRTSLQDDILYTYYSMYAVLMFLMFFMIPFQYFYYEEQDEESTTSMRCCGAFKYTIVFILAAAVLLILGAFLPLKGQPPTNSTEFEKVKFLFSELGNNRGMDAISFVLSVLCLIGMLCMIFYTGYGLASWPIGLIKGFRKAKGEHQEVIAERNSVNSRIRSIRGKYEGTQRPMSRRDMVQVSSLRENDRLLQREERYLEAATRSVLHKCYSCLRPFQLIFGILIALVTLLIFVSLVLSNIDKAMHSLGYKTGYTLPKRRIINPIDYILVHAEKIFPVDYILYTAMMFFFVFATMSGLRSIGIRFLWVKMYKIRPVRTRPQGLLMAVYILVFVILALNILVFSLSPVYTMYGNQHYRARVNSTGHKNTTTFVVKPCDTEAPADECLMTRASMLLTRFFYKAWFFGAAYYWCTWAFLLVSLIGLCIAFYIEKKSAIDGRVEDSDFEESDDDELITA